MTDEVRDMIRKALTGEPPIGIDYDDVRSEGRRRLARRHVVITTSAALGVVAVVGAALTVRGFAAGSAGDDPAAPAPSTTTSTTGPAPAGCVVPRLQGGFTSPPSGSAGPEELAESARLTEAFGRYVLPLPPGVTVVPAKPKLCAVVSGSWGTDFTLHGATGDRSVFLEVRSRAGQPPGECVRFGGQVKCDVRALPDGGVARISDTPPPQANQPEIVMVDAWRADGTVVRIMETGSEAAKPVQRILSDDAMVAIATAPELKVNLAGAPSPPAPVEPSDRRAAELTAALAKEFTLPRGMSARKVPQARAEAMAFFVSQGGYKLNADLVDAAGQGNLFINLNPPAGESSVACDNTPNCHVITLPDGRKAALAQTDDGITTLTLSTIAADGTQIMMWSRSQSAKAEGTSTRTRPQPPLGVDDLIRIASVTGLRW
ncbi:MAG TPA: hypothetical protein VGR06_15100 [Actinophytocola sp.]|jgi:hypothetical protein|uniref:hypothetical protein n=1 Tax=Actinophytocola sp. TaxID=1872138 RepID=UPI002DFBB153|nr:hypothetical protein [Actinophytocola sp.]